MYYVAPTACILVKKSPSFLFSYTFFYSTARCDNSRESFFSLSPSQKNFTFSSIPLKALDLKASASLRKNPLGYKDVSPTVLYTSAASNFKNSNHPIPMKLSHGSSLSRRKHSCRVCFMLSPYSSLRQGETNWDWVRVFC